MSVGWSLFYMLIFPGFFFLSSYGLICEWLDRKLYARFQNRVGPPWYQPEADFIKLMAKEAIIPAAGDPAMFRSLPVVALAAVLTAFLYIPVVGIAAPLPFEGDLVVVFYLLTIPTLTFFLAGWSSTSLFATLGSVRNLTQLFAYEVPLLIVLLGPALLAGTWSISGITRYFSAHPAFLCANLLGFGVAMIAAQGKLEKVPFDIPEAETEIVGGIFTEFTGRLLALFRLAIDLEMVVVAALLSAVFWGGTLGFHPVFGFLLFIIKTLAIIMMMTVVRSVTARVRLEQMVNFCWKVLAPAALVQLLINVILKIFIL